MRLPDLYLVVTGRHWCSAQPRPAGSNDRVPDMKITLPNGGTVPFNPLKGVVFDALSRSYSPTFPLSAAAALVAAPLTLIALRARSDEPLLDLETLDE
jgi:hypothetical protein